MHKRSSKDVNVIAAEVVEQATQSDKNPNAVALGRLGGLKGGKARAKRLTPGQLRRLLS